MMPTRLAFAFPTTRLPLHVVSRANQSDIFDWVLACLFGAACGWVHVFMNDTGLSVLMVTGFAMFLSYRRPRRFWWWAAIMGLSLPFAVLLSYVGKERPSLGMTAGSFAGLAFALVASVGGSVLRRVVAELFPPQKPAASEQPLTTKK